MITVSHRKNARTAFFIMICAAKSAAWGILGKENDKYGTD